MQILGKLLAAMAVVVLTGSQPTDEATPSPTKAEFPELWAFRQSAPYQYVPSMIALSRGCATAMIRRWLKDAADNQWPDSWLRDAVRAEMAKPAATFAKTQPFSLDEQTQLTRRYTDLGHIPHLVGSRLRVPAWFVCDVVRGRCCQPRVVDMVRSEISKRALDPTQNQRQVAQ